MLDRLTEREREMREARMESCGEKADDASGPRERQGDGEARTQQDQERKRIPSKEQRESARRCTSAQHTRTLMAQAAASVRVQSEIH